MILYVQSFANSGRSSANAAGSWQAQAAKRLRVTQPRVSDLVRGRIDLFSLDTLVDMAALAGLEPEVRLKRAA